MWLIIGYGNRLRGDDAAGPLLAEYLSEQLPAELVQVLAVHQLTPEIVEQLIRPEVGQVLFIDVKREQQEELCIAPLKPLAAAGNSIGHQLQPELLLFTAEKLYQRTIPGWLLTVPGSDFNFCEKLSQKTKAVFPKAMTLVQKLTESCP